MKNLLRQLAAATVVLGAVWALLTWPLIHDVETGKTPEYPELRPGLYAASEKRVLQAVEEVLARLPRWRRVGSGRGPAGSEVQAVRKSRVFGFEDEVTIRIKREQDLTKVWVRSRSKVGFWDLGQNARNIRELFEALDREVL